MKKQALLAVLLIFMMSVWGATTCWASKTGQTIEFPAVQKNLSKPVDNIRKEMKNGALLLDVRTAKEYTKSHAAGAVNMSHDFILSGKYPTENKTTKIYLYCRSGKRAGKAAEALKAAGYKNVIILGGLTDWQKMGGEMETN